MLVEGPDPSSEELVDELLDTADLLEVHTDGDDIRRLLLLMDLGVPDP